MAAAEISLAVQFPETAEIGLAVNMSASSGMITGPQITMLDEEGRISTVMKYDANDQISEVDLYEYSDGTISEIQIPANTEDWSALTKIITDIETQETTTTTTPMTMAMAKKVIQLTTRAGQDFLPIGMEIDMPWTDDDETEYSNPMILVAYKDMNKQGDSAETLTHVGIFRSKYATKINLPFDAAEIEEAQGTWTVIGYSYYGRNIAQGGGYTWTLLLLNGRGQTDQIVRWRQQYNRVIWNQIADSSMNIAKTGYSRWERSAWRKYLNSDEAEGAWWTPSHAGDTAPSGISDTSGYLAGLREEDLAAIATVKVQTALYPGTDSKWGEAEAKQERFWLPSVEEMYGVAPTEIAEGGAWTDYWESLGMDDPTNSSTAERKVYKINDHETVASVRLRSCSQSAQGQSYVLNASGGVSTVSCSNSSYNGLVCCAVG